MSYANKCFEALEDVRADIETAVRYLSYKTRTEEEIEKAIKVLKKALKRRITT